MTFKLKIKKELTKKEEKVRAFQAQEPALRKPWEKKNIIVIMELTGGQCGSHRIRKWAEARLVGRGS